MSRDIEGTIAHLGGQGDGVMNSSHGTLFVPFTLPGERVAVRLAGKGKHAAQRGEGGQQAQLREILAPSPDRIEPPCMHVPACGGCAVQHLAELPYRDWKRAKVLAALERHGLPADVVAPLIAGKPGSRRRIDLSARRLASGTVLGFTERGSHRIINLEQCIVTDARLVSIFAPLRDTLDGILPVGGAADLVMTQTDTGIDILVRGRLVADTRLRQAFAAFANQYDIARLSLAASHEEVPEEVLRRRAPQLSFGGIAVTLPPGGFSQASAHIEAEMQRLVVAAAEGARRVCDLFSGLGTFALPLLAAGSGRVLAADGDEDAIAALRAAANANGLSGRLMVEARDLVRRPVMAAELDDWDAVVFDPPRAGAREQVQQIARSKVARVIGVSCNPATFARDAHALVDAGFRLQSVTPLDQFLWSPHVELVAVLAR